MRVLLDSNVALDHILKREPFFNDAEKVLALVSANVEFFLSASAVTDVFYISRKHLRSKIKAMDALKKILLKIKIAALDDADIRRAVALEWGDFEDAVQFVAGEEAFVDCIVTRDKSNYPATTPAVLSPDEFLSLLQG